MVSQYLQCLMNDVKWVLSLHPCSLCTTLLVHCVKCLLLSLRKWWEKTLVLQVCSYTLSQHHHVEYEILQETQFHRGDCQDLEPLINSCMKAHGWKFKWTVTCDSHQCGILTSVDSDEPVQTPFNLRNSKWCSVSSLTLKAYSSDKQRLWLDCAYGQADWRLCW